MALVSPYQDNRPTPAPNTDIGFKVSKPGFNARTAAGQNMIFSTSWPSLSVVFEGVFDTSVLGGDFFTGVLATHNLKFPPLAFMWVYGNDSVGKTGVIRRYVCSVDSTKVYVNTGGMSTDDSNFVQASTKISVKCFNLDLSKDIDYTLAPGDTYKIPYDPDFGVKVVKQFKDINSRDMRDFLIHSRCQTPLILAVKTKKTSNAANPTIVQYRNKANYQVWVYGFVRSTAGVYRYATFGGQAYPLTATDGILSYVGYSAGPGDDDATLVILRDPMFAANEITIQY